ncbi:hypothetical protein ACFROC_28805 [Nocardia tengchongensis]|uniref:hypothetical protein n=1 Tax=Nocardia tengchongensis TaxID=2055889 RepID=UPI00367AB019
MRSCFAATADLSAAAGRGRFHDAQAQQLAVTLVNLTLVDGVVIGADHELFDEHQDPQLLLHTRIVVLGIYSYLNTTFHAQH